MHWKWSLLFPLAVLCACATTAVGELAPIDHAHAGRPREALAGLEKTKPSSPVIQQLQRGMLLHSSGDFSRSEAAWADISEAAPLHDVERAMLARLRLLSSAVLRQDVTLLEPLLKTAGVEGTPLGRGQASIVVIVELGWAPYWVGTATGLSGIARGPVSGSRSLRLDDSPAVEARLLVDETSSWNLATQQRNTQRPDAFEGSAAGLLWWSAPTQLAYAELVTNPGAHVLLLPTPQGLRERVIVLSAGQRLVVVTRS